MMVKLIVFSVLALAWQICAAEGKGYDLSNAYLSPVNVAAQNRSEWLALWAKDATIEDPVGGMVHGTDGHTLAEFWDTFIAGRDIHFDVKQDYISTNTLIRDVVITTRTHGIEVPVPAILRYKVDSQGMITSMEAFWEILESSKPLATSGFSGVSLVTDLTYRLIKNQGLTGIVSMTKSYFPAGAKQRKKRTKELIQALAKGEYPKDIKLDESQSREDVLEHFRDAVVLDKVIAAGKSVAFRYENLEGINIGIATFDDNDVIALDFYHL